jgi:sugar/nucleoside kinase (ribokinase family)
MRFQAAMLHALAERSHLHIGHLRHLDGAVLHDVLGFANKAAALVCTRQGADPARRWELEAQAA